MHDHCRVCDALCMVTWLPALAIRQPKHVSRSEAASAEVWVSGLQLEYCVAASMGEIWVASCVTFPRIDKSALCCCCNIWLGVVCMNFARNQGEAF